MSLLLIATVGAVVIGAADAAATPCWMPTTPTVVPDFISPSVIACNIVGSFPLTPSVAAALCLSRPAS
jgi:hypothetical protein